MTVGIARKKQELVKINSSNVEGETGTGFEKRNEGRKSGPFECGNCEYFLNNSCGQEDMMKYSKQPRLSNDRVVVHKEDCCDYIDRVK